MDAYTHTKLDQLLAVQREHGELLKQLATDRKQGAKSGFTQKLKLPVFWQTLAAGLLTWGVTILISSYLRHGGDPVKIIELLLKLLGSMVGV